MRRASIRALACLLSAPALAQMGAGNQPRDVFSNFDTDRDGTITRYEAWQGNILNRFDQMDQDEDGEVTEPEFNAMDAPGIASDAEVREEQIAEDEGELVPRVPFRNPNVRVID